MCHKKFGSPGSFKHEQDDKEGLINGVMRTTYSCK